MKKDLKEATSDEIRTLRSIYENESLLMNFPKSEVGAMETIIEEIFNPTKKRSSLLKLVNNMPLAKNFPEQDLEKLESLGYVIILPAALDKRVTITPEGIMILVQDANGLTIHENLRDTAYYMYRRFCFHKIERLRKKEKLKSKHIAVLLFFLLNGSIGKSKSYRVRSYADLSSLEQIVMSYLSNGYIDVEDNYALKYYLVEAKRILGDIAFNKKPDYYLKKETLDYVIKSIYDTIKEDKSFQERWERFKNTYKKNITLLRTRGNSQYSASWEIKLDRRLLKGS